MQDRVTLDRRLNTSTTHYRNEASASTQSESTDASLHTPLRRMVSSTTTEQTDVLCHMHPRNDSHPRTTAVQSHKQYCVYSLQVCHDAEFTGDAAR
jgi:hypothetical protein